MKKLKGAYALAIIDGDGFAKAAFMAGGGRQLAHRFMSRVFALNRDHPGARIAVAWDREDSSDERLERFPDYKKSRRGKPSRFAVPEYLEPMVMVRSLLRALGVAQLEAPGWEADDVLATAVRRVKKGRSLVLTRDRDLLQLVSRDVDVLLRVGSDDHLVDLAEANRRLPVPIGLYRWWKALAGDSGDDVPGVPGIGEKGATELLKWNPSVAPETSALGRPQGTPPKGLEGAVRKLERAGKEWMHTQIFLVTLHDVELEVDRGCFDRAVAEDLMHDLKLRKLGDRIGEWLPRGKKRRLKVRRRRDLEGVEFTTVKSSNLAAVGERDGDLFVLFKKGRAYRYEGGGPLLPELLAAESVGRFFHERVKDLPCSEVSSVTSG